MLKFAVVRLVVLLAVLLCALPALGYMELEWEPVWEHGPKICDIWTEPVTGMEFVWVPEGCFQMGQSEAEKNELIKQVGQEDYGKYCADELPQHEVCVDGFWMGRYEVTNAQYRRFKADYDSESYKGHFLNGDSQPVVSVSWNGAVNYARWLAGRSGKAMRLPTEAEWEYAARAGITTASYWGKGSQQACGYANVADATAKRQWSGWTVHDCDDGYAVAAPVGTYRPNAFGLYDMLGNVWEWCQDWYATDYYRNSPRSNPAGPSGGSNRVFRGGSWVINPGGVRLADRYRCMPDIFSNALGFRLVFPARSR